MLSDHPTLDAVGALSADSVCCGVPLAAHVGFRLGMGVRPHVNVSLIYDRDIGVGKPLVALQQTLQRHAPEWSRHIRLFEAPRIPPRVELDSPYALRRVLVKDGSAVGPTYRALVEQYGEFNPRRNGSSSVRGDKTDLIVVAGFDQWPVVRWRDGSLRLHNRISLQTTGTRFRGRPIGEWTNRVFAELVEQTAPAWGAIYDNGEYHAKVMSHEPGVGQALGIDFGRYLPGLFSSNFFGRPYVRLIGRRQLLTAPAEHVAPAGKGVVVSLGDPLRWDDPVRQASEALVLDHLGRQRFFDRDRRDATGDAPEWRVRELE